MPSSSSYKSYRIERVRDDSPPRRKLKRNTPKAAVSHEIKTISKSVQAFANDLFKVVASDQKGNYVSSSLSAHVALAMTAYGAEGSTRKQMLQGLHLPTDDKLAHKGFVGFLQALNNIPGVILQLANKIYISKDRKIKHEYKTTLDSIFQSESDSVDFGETAEVVKNANKWCTEKSKGKINKIISSDDIAKDTVFILLNAVYFNGNWENRFDGLFTKPKPFYVDSTTTVQVPMMYKKRQFPYKDLEQYHAECVAIPYKNDDLSMIIVLPKDVNGLEHIEKSWEKINSECLNASLFDNYELVSLNLPRFKVDTLIPLEKYLRQLGIDEMFSSKANFKGISDTFINITGAKQKAFIEVNEEGTEAFAITSQCGGGPGGPPPKVIEFNVDRPFLFQIYDSNLEISLFNGRVVNPNLY